ELAQASAQLQSFEAVVSDDRSQRLKSQIGHLRWRIRSIKRVLSEMHQPPSVAWSVKSRTVLPVSAGLLAVLPIVQISRHLLLRRRRKTGCCMNCGYDLRATPDRCP